MNIIDMYLPHEVCAKMKELGFDDLTDYYYRDMLGSDEKIFYRLHPSMRNTDLARSNHNMVTGIPFDHAKHWFYTKYNLSIEENSTIVRGEWTCIVVDKNNHDTFYPTGVHTSRRAAIIAGMNRAIEFVKSKTEEK